MVADVQFIASILHCIIYDIITDETHRASAHVTCSLSLVYAGRASYYIYVISS